MKDSGESGLRASGAAPDALRGESLQLRRQLEEARSQLDSTRAQLSALRAQFDRLLSEARANQAKLRRFDQIERQLIAAPSLTALVQVLLMDFGKLFELDAVTLALVDPQYEAARVISEELHAAQAAEQKTAQGAGQKKAAQGPQGHGGADLVNSGIIHWSPRLLLLGSAQALAQLHLIASDARPDSSTQALRPLLGRPDPSHAFLFQGLQTQGVHPQELASTALLPLVHRGECIGSLNLGSREATRFTSGVSTDFLERLAALAAICVDNALVAERLKLVGLTDALTGVHNRRYFESRCLEEVKAAQRNGHPLICLLLDVDHFKRINDSYGHPAGDAVLRQVGQLIRSQLRGNDVVARYGGEEFVLLLPDTQVGAGIETAERIRSAIAAQAMPMQTSERGAEPLRVTVSLGVSQLQLDASARDSSAQEAMALMRALVQQADSALYAAKQGGRNRVMAHQAESQEG